MQALTYALPLDFYQILNVPHNAQIRQIEQAFLDRKAQLPRTELSEQVKQERQNLILRAYETLSNEEERKLYDQNLAVSTSKLQLEHHQLVAGLVLLLESGEAPEVLSSINNFQPSFSSGTDSPFAEEVLSSISKFQPSFSSGTDSSSAEQDLTLLAILAHKELAQELRLRGQLEAAAAELEAASLHLQDSGKFLSLQKELDQWLLHIRPERVLTLLKNENPESRTLGITLFQQWLQDREGIEGNGSDGSGLDRDGIFQFLETVLPLLDGDEQLQIFAPEAERPSVAAAYLAAQALLAKGYTSGDPHAVRKARGYFMRLNQRRDVHIALAVCALLLGQAEEAERALENSKETGILDIIKQRSEGSPDLLPGLCQYAEEWLGTLTRQIRDLKSSEEKEARSLKAYFAHSGVQTYLENLSGNDNGQKDADSLNPIYMNQGSLPPRSPIRDNLTVAQRTRSSSQKNVIPRQSLPQDGRRRRRGSLISPNGVRKLGWTAAVMTLVVYGGFVIYRNSTSTISRTAAVEPTATIATAPTTPKPAEPVNPGATQPITTPQAIVGEPLQPEQPVAKPAIAATTPTTPTPPESVAATATTSAQVTPEIAGQVLTDWQKQKAEALGSKRNLAGLAEVLAEPELSRWKSRASGMSAKAQWNYTLKDLKVSKVSPKGPTKVDVTAEVSENAEYLVGGKKNEARSYSKPYKATYTLVKQKDQWKITYMKVL
ncbi:MAG: IMS domain-containing protein [Gloeobacterales cyanobacterium]